MPKDPYPNVKPDLNASHDMTSWVVESFPNLAALVATLRARNTDPAYADAPVLDAYARLSKDPEGKWEAVDRQLEIILTNMIAMGYRLAEILCDNNESAWAKRRNRPAFNRFLARVLGGMVNGAFVYDVDRLMRQPWDLEMILHMGSCQLASREAIYNLSNMEHQLFLRIRILIAAYESDVKSKRERDKNARRRADGFTDGRICFGHAFAPTDDTELAAKQAAMLPTERDAVAWGIQAIVDGSVWRQVANEWNARDILSRGGYRWNALKVRNILTLPRHAGLIVHKGEKPVAFHPSEVTPIVSVELWELFQARLNARKTNGRPRGDYLLSGFLHCPCRSLAGESGVTTSMRANAGSGRAAHIYAYRCTPAACNGNYLRADVAERLVRDLVVSVLSQADHPERIAERRGLLGQIGTELATLQSDMDELTQRRYSPDALLRVSPDAYTRAMAAMNARMAELEAERRDLIGDGASEPVPTYTANDAARTWDTGTDTDRRRMIKSAAPNGFIVRPFMGTPRTRQTLENCADRIARIGDE